MWVSFKPAKRVWKCCCLSKVLLSGVPVQSLLIVFSACIKLRSSISIYKNNQSLFSKVSPCSSVLYQSICPLTYEWLMLTNAMPSPTPLCSFIKGLNSVLYAYKRDRISSSRFRYSSQDGRIVLNLVQQYVVSYRRQRGQFTLLYCRSSFFSQDMKE